MVDFFDYADAAATADLLITEFGPLVGAVLVKKRFGAPIDAAKPWEGLTKSDANVDVKAVLLPASSGKISSFDSKDETNSAAQNERRFVLISPISPTTGVEIVSADHPSDEDRIQINGLDLEITGVTEVAPAGVFVLFKCGVRVP